MSTNVHSNDHQPNDNLDITRGRPVFPPVSLSTTIKTDHIRWKEDKLWSLWTVQELVLEKGLLQVRNNHAVDRCILLDKGLHISKRGERRFEMRYSFVADIETSHIERPGHYTRLAAAAWCKTDQRLVICEASSEEEASIWVESIKAAKHAGPFPYDVDRFKKRLRQYGWLVSGEGV